MLSKKDLKVALFTAFCIFLNLSGSYFARYFSLPLWLDSFGTVISAYIFGPVCGSIVGVTMNLIGSDFPSFSYMYAFTSVAIAVVVGIAARRKWFETLYGTVSASLIVTGFSVAISVAISWIFADGMTFNLWGDGVIRYLEEQGMPRFLSSVIGQFYIDFLDKVIAVFLPYIGIKIWKNRKKFLRLVIIEKSKIKQKRAQSKSASSNPIKCVPILFATLFFCIFKSDCGISA